MVYEVFRMKGRTLPIFLACEHHGIESMLDLMGTLTYVTQEGRITDIQSGHMGLLHNIEEFVRHLVRREGDDINWMVVTHDNYIQYMTIPLQEFEKGTRRFSPRKNASSVTTNAIGSTFVPPHLRTTMTMGKTMTNTVAHNIRMEVTGGEIKFPNCNSGEASNTHTMIGTTPEFNYGETNNKQTPHNSGCL
jgi:hypothetical protein